MGAAVDLDGTVLPRVGWGGGVIDERLKGPSSSLIAVAATSLGAV